MSRNNIYKVRKRIGKDVVVSFDVKTNGELRPLEGRDLLLELIDPWGGRSKIPFSVSGTTVTFRFYGRDQQSTGDYRLTLWENLGKDGQSVVDICSVLTLVPATCQESDMGEGGLEVEGVNLGIVNLEVGVRGASAYETWLKHGHEGTEEDFLAWLRQPASDAAEDALKVAQQGASDAVRIAEEAAGRADASAGRADSAADNAETAIESISEKQKEIDAAETLRKKAEGGRVKAELERVSSETERKRAEEARVAAEQQRQSDTASAIRETVEAADRANTAALSVQENILGLSFDDNTGRMSVVLGTDTSNFERGAIQDNGKVRLEFNY